MKLALYLPNLCDRITVAEATKSRVFFSGGKDLDRFVVWDYVKQRRKIIA